MAVAVRRSDGSVAMLEKPFISITRKFKVLGWPFLRGAVSLFETLYLGMTALQFSADEASKDEEGRRPWGAGRRASSRREHAVRVRARQ
jgi:uncharacterized protein YqhQ